MNLDGWLDEKLARGMSREIFRNTSKSWDRFTVSSKGKSAHRKEGRASLIREIKTVLAKEQLYLGLAYDQDLMRFSFGTVFPENIQEDWRVLSIDEIRFNLYSTDPNYALQFKRICVIDIHAVRRLIERTGVHGQDSVLKSFLPAIQWCQALRHGCRPRAALLPLGDHLVAVKGTKTREGVLTPRIVTFLDRRNMSEANIEMRRRLEPLAQQSPMFPSYRDFSPELESLAKLAWACGAEWEARQEARMKRDM